MSACERRWVSALDTSVSTTSFIFEIILDRCSLGLAKGDHKHVGDLEEDYHFRNVETLVADFLAEIEKARRK